MKDQLISLETAKLAKEKEFNIPCIFFYVLNHKPGDKFILIGNVGDIQQIGGEMIEEDHNNSSYLLTRYSAPTQSLLQRWLREVHGFHVSPELLYMDSNGGEVVEFYASIESMPIIQWIYESTEHFRTYEEALEEGLIKALNLIEK